MRAGDYKYDEEVLPPGLAGAISKAVDGHGFHLTIHAVGPFTKSEARLPPELRAQGRKLLQERGLDSVRVFVRGRRRSVHQPAVRARIARLLRLGHQQRLIAKALGCSRTLVAVVARTAGATPEDRACQFTEAELLARGGWKGAPQARYTTQEYRDALLAGMEKDAP